MKYFSLDTGVINHWEDEQLMLYPTQAFFAVCRMSFDGLKEWHCWYCSLSVNNAQRVELSRSDLVSVCIFFIMEEILSNSALELGMVINALTILAISGNLGVMVILFFMAMTSLQKMSVLVSSEKLGSSMEGMVWKSKNSASNWSHWSLGIKEGNRLARSVRRDGCKSPQIVGLRNLRLEITGSLKGNFSSILAVTDS